MKINKENAIKFWKENYGNVKFAEDFHGCLMCIDGYGDSDYYVIQNGQKIYCGWNIHHILPEEKGGSNEKINLTCTNIFTNEEAGNKITYWIESSLYQVRKIFGTRNYEIFKIR